MRLIALICNIIVVTGGTIIFITKNQVNWNKIIPIAIISIPMAFLGAIIKLSQNTFFIILGCSLIIASVLLWVKTKGLTDAELTGINKKNYVKDGFLGGAIGLLSGMVGIGG